MGLLQRAIETYDANTALIGVYRDGHEPLAPIGHILTAEEAVDILQRYQGADFPAPAGFTRGLFYRGVE